VLITAGGNAAKRSGVYRVRKRELIAGLHGLLERGEFKIASGLGTREALVRELAEMRVRVTQNGHEQFGAWRRGEHDDLVLAVALACWTVRAKREGSITAA
jgi:hypothetical protein